MCAQQESEKIDLKKEVALKIVQEYQCIAKKVEMRTTMCENTASQDASNNEITNRKRVGKYGCYAKLVVEKRRLETKEKFKVKNEINSESDEEEKDA